MAHSNSRNLASGAARLSRDMATLINNRQGSDIQFKVGDSADCVTIYAHSAVLCCRSRYFAAMLDEQNSWKESAKGVINKPNISPSTFRDVLYYIYTGVVCAKTTKNIIDLIAAADEMDLEELSTECQAELIRTVKYIFSDEDDNGNEGEDLIMLDESTKQLSIDVALRTHIIPALNLANNHTLSHLSQKLLKIMLPRMNVIITSPAAYTTFIDGISSETLTQILASDNLVMTEKNIWDLALNWGCYHTSLTKAAVEARLSNAEEDDDDDDDDDDNDLTRNNPNHPSVSTTQLKQLKTILAPLLPIIRFSLFEPEDYANMIDILNYFLPRRRSSELQRFFIKPDYTRLLDMPRKESAQKIPSKIVIGSKMQKLLKEYIFEAGGMIDCHSLNHLKFELLFRASEHGFLADTFHRCCDKKGPTLTLIRSNDGHLFGGVNFADWNSRNNYGIHDASPSHSQFTGFSTVLNSPSHNQSTGFGFNSPSYNQPISYGIASRGYASPSHNQSFSQPSFSSFITKSNTSINNLKNVSINNSSFLFALVDERHRRDSVIFKHYGNNTHTPRRQSQMRGSLARPSPDLIHGPSFGENNGQFDLYIANCANENRNSFSNLPNCYNGTGASNTALAGAEYFMVSDYEVFAILNVDSSEYM